MVKKPACFKNPAKPTYIDLRITNRPGMFRNAKTFKTGLKVKSCKLYNNKYMIASTQITNTKIFAFMTVLVFKLLSRKVLFINRKDNINC